MGGILGQNRWPRFPHPHRRSTQPGTVGDGGGKGGAGAGGSQPIDASLGDAATDRPDDTRPTGRCVGRKPPRALITDFSSLDNSAFGVSPVDVVVGQPGASGNLQFDFSNADWRISGRPFPEDSDAEVGLDWGCEDISDQCPMDASGGRAPFDVDLTIDDIRFIPR